MCRDFTYLEDYLSLELALEECELVLLEIISPYSKAEFKKFIDWHRAILLHKKEKKIADALEILARLVTLNNCVSELDICIANSMGLIHLSNKNNDTALKIYKKIYPLLKTKKFIEDHTLIPRVGYNYANNLFKIKRFTMALEIIEEVRYYLEVHHMIYSLGEVYHLTGVLNKKLGLLNDAEEAFKNAILIFTFTQDEINLARTEANLSI